MFDLLDDLYLLPIEGGEARALTHSIACEMQTRFSPDGQKMAFVSDAGGGDTAWMMKADDSEPFVTGAGGAIRPTPSPHGRFLAFVRRQREGQGAHREMWAPGLGGMTPLEAIRSATLNPAQVLGLDRDIGSLEVGRLADLEVLEGDVLADIRHSDRIAQVMLGGRLYEARSMNEVGAGQRNKPRKPFFFEGVSGIEGQVPIDEHALDDELGVGHVRKH